MNEFIKYASEILDDVLPPSIIGALTALTILALILLVLTGRFKLEWIGIGIRHIYRWLACKLWDKHRYELSGIGWTDLATGFTCGKFICDVWGKVQIVR